MCGVCETENSGDDDGSSTSVHFVIHDSHRISINENHTYSLSLLHVCSLLFISAMLILRAFCTWLCRMPKQPNVALFSGCSVYTKTHTTVAIGNLACVRECLNRLANRNLNENVLESTDMSLDCR